MVVDSPKEKQGRKTPRERFLIVAERRTIRILKNLRLLANCSKRGAYEYTEEDTQKIFDAIQQELDRAKAAFADKKTLNFRLR
jgi:hypothetical protein